MRGELCFVSDLSRGKRWARGSQLGNETVWNQEP